MRKMMFLALTLTMLSAASVKAQVLIGGGATDSPATGTILDLRNMEASKGGFLLPRVVLTDMGSLVDISGENKDAAALTGLVVYNITPVAEGIYVWDGSRWDRLTTMDRNYCLSVVKDTEGNSYSTGWFGEAGCWMTQNLRSTRTSTGETLIADLNSSFSNAAYYYYPNADQDILNMHPEYGLLYTWAAANYGTDPAEENDAFAGIVSTRQGICPTGWHLPSDYEWNQLEEEIAKSAAGVYSTSSATTWESSYIQPYDWRGSHGAKMKSTTAVNNVSTNGTSNTRTSNGFDVLLVGYWGRGDEVGFVRRAGFWSSSSIASSFAWFRWLDADFNSVLCSAPEKYNLMSIRCKQN